MKESPTIILSHRGKGNRMWAMKVGGGGGGGGGGGVLSFSQSFTRNIRFFFFPSIRAQKTPGKCSVRISESLQLQPK